MADRRGTGSSVRRLAFCGVFAALTIVMLYIGGLTVLDLSVLMLCSFITILVAIETGTRACVIYSAATSVLALILLPSKLYAVEYALFSAAYPLLRPLIERLGRLSFVLKIAALDAMLLGCVLLGQYAFNMGEEFYSLGAVTMLVGTVFFILYDILLGRVITFYFARLRGKIKLYKFL